MNGKIKVFSGDVSAGLILSVDGKIYPFLKQEWLSSPSPKNNMKVTFDDKFGRAWQAKAA